MEEKGWKINGSIADGEVIKSTKVTAYGRLSLKLVRVVRRGGGLSKCTLRVVK